VLPLRLWGNHIVNSNGQRVRLVGFNSSGAEYACEDGFGIFDTPSPKTVSRSIVAAMASWQGANVVRVPLDEQCWLDIGGVKAQYAGAHYRQAIRHYVTELNAAGFAVVLDLQNTAPGNERSLNQEEMPDSHSIAFWAQVATVFRTNRSVLFDLFNEPWPYDSYNSARAWKCWRDGGCRLPSQNGHRTYIAVGYDQLIKAVRGTGARNIVMAGGLAYSESLDQWLKYEPRDPDHELIASTHIYSFNQCSTLRCYNGALSKVASRVPLFIAEFGPDLTVGFSAALDRHCPSKDVGNTGFDRTLLSWAAAHGASWSAWSWNPWGDCWSLVKNFKGATTRPWGDLVKRELDTYRQQPRA
jgi:endoglucanase